MLAFVDVPEHADELVAEVLSTGCACLSLRQASRVVTQMYDDALRPAGLRATQFGLLMAVRAVGRMTISELADFVIMDRTTLTRNLRPLEKNGYLRVEPGEDRRMRRVSLTRKGRTALEKAFPLWKEVQTQVMDKLGRRRYERLRSDLGFTVEASRHS